MNNQWTTFFYAQMHTEYNVIGTSPLRSPFYIVSEPDPWKIVKEGWVNWLGWKYTLRLECRRTSDWLWLAFWCAFIGNANCTRTVFMFCFVLESCKHQVGKIERLYACLVQQKTLQALQGLAINKFLTFHSAHFHPALFTRSSFPIFQGSGSETTFYKWAY